MSKIFTELEEEYKKSGIFNSGDIPVSYPTGFPILDQNLGGTYIYPLPDGTCSTVTRVGVPAASITQIGGPSSTGKTAAAIQMGVNIVESFDSNVDIIHIDEEHATDFFRVVNVAGISFDWVRENYHIYQQNNTWEEILKRLNLICEKKESNKKDYLYDTGVTDIYGNPFIYYKPTILILDSLLKIVSQGEDTTGISGGTSAGRETIARNKFFRNLLILAGKYNINTFIINHTADDMDLGKPGGKSKQFTFIETGKKLPGGDRVQAWSTSIIVFKPNNAKDKIKHEEFEGYNGLSIGAMVVKSRSSIGGTIAMQEFSQEYGYNPILTLINLAIERDLFRGVNPNRYFETRPDVKFDTRKFVKEIEERPELVDALLEATSPVLKSMIRVYDMREESSESSDNPVKSIKARINIRERLRNLAKT